MRAEIRDFRREAEFGLIAPVFAALSISWYAFGRSFIASDLLPADTSFLSSFTTVDTSSLCLMLKTRLRFDALRAFFAEDVIGINNSEVSVTLTAIAQKCKSLGLCAKKAPNSAIVYNRRS